ncbi:uncharacterized protein [Apostichopus japonicus]|uniref:uncharacterized protein isoform X3 n=1 Tax=Stichopus japonicus TaxID=307972 RepID=UPI003AB59DB3
MEPLWCKERDGTEMKVPSIFTQRTLTECGLWEKKVLIPSDLLPSEVMDVITRYYPELRDVSGFENMKADGLSKCLHVIPIPGGGFTAANLKNVAKHAKIYLRPIQCDLALATTTTTNTDENEVQIKCNNCNVMIPQTKLRSHVRSCRLPGQDARHICDYINIVDPDDDRDQNDEVLNAVIEESLLEVQDTSLLMQHVPDMGIFEGTSPKTILDPFDYSSELGFISSGWAIHRVEFDVTEDRAVQYSTLWFPT